VLHHHHHQQQQQQQLLQQLVMIEVIVTRVTADQELLLQTPAVTEDAKRPGQHLHPESAPHKPLDSQVLKIKGVGG